MIIAQGRKNRRNHDQNGIRVQNQVNLGLEVARACTALVLCNITYCGAGKNRPPLFLFSKGAGIITALKAGSPLKYSDNNGV